MTDELHDILRGGIFALEEEFDSLDSSFKTLASIIEGSKGDAFSGMWNRTRSQFYDLFDKVHDIEKQMQK